MIVRYLKNVPPTVKFHTDPPVPLYKGAWFPVRATGNDDDHNLGGVWVEYSVNGGEWQALAYDPASGDNGNGWEATTNNNSVLAGPPGTRYVFRCYAWDQAGANSGWRYSDTYTVVDRPGSGTFTIAGSPTNASISFGQAVTIASSVTDPDGNMTVHSFWWDQGNGTRWTHPFLEWNAPANRDGWYNLNLGSNGYDASGGSSTRSFDFRPVRAATYAFHNVVADPVNWVGVGASVLYLTVGKAMPQINGWVNQSRTGTGTFPSAFNVSLANPYSTAVSVPTGALTYTVIGASGPGASPTSGVVGPGTNFTPGTYTIRCSYPGDGNYHAVSRDVTFTVANRAPTASLSVNKTAALVGESVTVTMTVSDPDGNLDYTNLWVQTPALGWRWIRADNTVVTGGSLTRANSSTAYGASGTFTRTFTFTGAQGVGTYRFMLAAVDVAGARTDASAQPTVAVSKITPGINVSLPGSVVYGASLPAWASSSVSGSFSYSPAVGTVLGAGTHTVTVTFTPSDPTTYNSATKTATWVVAKAPLTVKANNAAKVYGAANPAFTATYTGFVNGDTASAVAGVPGFSTTATAASGIGSYPVTPSVGTLAAANYVFATFQPGTLTISPKAVSFDFTNTSFVYDGGQKAPVIGNPNGATYTVSGITSATDAGSYSFTVTANGNYTGSSTCSWSIGRKPVTFTFSNLEFFYDNTPKAPTIHNPHGATYDVSGVRTAVVPNSYSFTVNATGNFIGSATCNWAIGCCPADVFLGSLNHTYDGTPKAATATTQPEGLNVVFTYDGSSTPPTDAGSYSVIANVADSPDPSREDPAAVFIGHAEGTLVIAKADQAPLVLSADTTQTHGSTQTLSTSGGSGTGAVTFEIVAQSPASSVSISGAVLSVNSGTGWVDVRARKTGDANYNPSSPSDTVRVTFAKASQNSLAVVASTPQIFNTNQSLSTTGGSGSGDVSYSIVEESAPGVALLSGLNNQTLTAATGTGWVKVRATKAGDANYNSISSAPTTIAFAKAAATLAFTNLNPVYDGTEKQPSVTTAPESGLAVQLTFDGQASMPINAGAYTVVGTINDPDYAGTKTETFTIQKAPATVALSSLNHTYDGSPKSATATTAPAGLTVNFTYDGSPTPPKDAGSYVVVGTIDAPNHTGSATGTLVINKGNQAALTLTATSPQTMGTSQTLSATGGSGGGALSYSIVAQSSSGAASLVGAVLVPNIGTGWVDVRATRAGGTNYHDVHSNLVRVNFGKATATITLGSLRHTYDGAVKTASATTTPGGLPVTVSYGPGNRVDAGSYSVTAAIATSDPNYTGSVSGTLVIDPAPQTVSISASPASAAFGQSIRFDAHGGKNGYIWGGAASGSGSSVTVTPMAAGPVTVTAHSPAGGNYLRSNDAIGEAMVTRVVPTGTFPGKTVNGPYTLKSADLQATFAHPTNPAMPPPTGTPTYEPAAGTKLNAGTHTITASYPGDNNYAPTTVAAIFVVNRTTPDIFWNPAPLRYGEAYGPGQRGAVAKVGDQTIPGTFTYTPAPGNIATTVGTKELRVHFTPEDSANYNAVLATRTITIGRGLQTIRFEKPEDCRYGGEVLLTATSSSGLSINYDVSGAQLVDATSNSGGKAIKADRLGTVTVTARQSGNEYYEPADPVTHQFTIQKALHTVEFPDPATTGYVLLAKSTAGIPVKYELSDETGGWVIRDVYPIDPNLPPFKQLAFTGYLPNKNVRVTAIAEDEFHEKATAISPMFSSSGPDSFWITRPADKVVAAQGYHLSFYAHHSISPDDSQMLKLFARHNGSSQWTELGSGYFNAHGIVNTGVFIAQAGTWEIKVVNGPDANSPDYSNHRLTLTAVNGQVINFPDRQWCVVNEVFNLGATTTAPGLSVTYHVIEGPVEFVTSSSIKVTKPGPVTIEARQSGNSSYAPAKSVRRTFTALSPPQLTIEEPLSYSIATGILSAKGWALDYEDGAPIPVTLVIDGQSHDVAVVQERPDIAAQAAAQGWSTGNVLKCGWKIEFPVASLAEGPHDVVIRAVDGSENVVEKGFTQFIGGTPVERTETIVFTEIGPRGFGEEFTLDATATSGRLIEYSIEAGHGLVTLSGNRVTVGNSPGAVTIRASVPASAGYSAASVERTFSIADGDGDGDGVPDWWEWQFDIDVTPGSDANGDGVKDIDEYHLWRNPKQAGGGQPKDTVTTILNVTAKGSGVVTLNIGGEPHNFSFLGAGDQWQEPYPFGNNVKTFAEIKAKLGDETEIAVSWPSTISDFIIKAAKSPIAASELRSRVELIARGSQTPIHFADAISKSELVGANGGNKIAVRAMVEGSLPFGFMDTSKLEVQRRVRFGLGGTRSGDAAGMIVYSADNYVLGGGLMNFAIVKGPAMTDVREHLSDPKRFQARVPAGYVDVYRLRDLITIDFYPDGNYPDDGPFKNFSGATRLVGYRLAGGLMAKTGSIRQTSGGNELLFEFENDRSVGESRTDSENGGYTLRRSYVSTFRHWGWRKPSAAREGMTSVRSEMTQQIMFGSGNSPGNVSNNPIFVKIYRHQGPTDSAGILSQEEHQFGVGDTELRYGATAVLRGSAADLQTASHRFTKSPSTDLSPPTTEVNATGGKMETEYFTASRIIGGSSNFDGHPGFVAGERKKVRRGFLDGGPDAADAIVTSYTYKHHLVDGRAVPATEITKQGNITVGDVIYEYPTTGAGQVIIRTLALPAHGATRLPTTLRAYSRRLANLDLRDKPISLTRPDETRTVYSYRTSGENLIVAELQGKAGGGVTQFAGTTLLETLDMDANRSTVIERTFDKHGRLTREESYVYQGNSNFTSLGSVVYEHDVFGNLTKKTHSSGRVLYEANYEGFRKISETDEQGITLTYTYDDYNRVKKVKRAAAADGANVIAETTTTYTYDPIGRLEKEVVSAAGATETLESSYTYDTANRPKSRTVPGNLTTIISYDSAIKTTTTLPGGGTKIEEVHKDGRVKSVTGTAVSDMTTTYAYDATTGNLKTTQNTAGQWATTESDWAGRTVSVSTPTYAGTIRVVGNTYTGALLTKQETKVGTTAITLPRLFQYDSYARLVREGLDENGNGVLDPSTDYEVKEYEWSYQTGAPNHAANLYRYEGVKVWPYAGANASTSRFASQTYTQVTGLGPSTMAHVVSLDFDQNITDSTTTIDRAGRKVVVSTTTTGTTATLQEVRLNGLPIKSVNAQGHATLQTYDALGRLEAIDDPRIGPTSHEYHSDTTLVESITGPDLRTTQYGYDAAGRVISQINPDGKTAYFQYDAAGNLTHQWGETVNPVKYVYNDLGQKTEMHTYRSGSWTGSTLPSGFASSGDKTTWTYQSATGLLTEKKDAVGATTSFEYTDLGQMKKRTDARGWVTNYEYTDARKLLTKVVYTGTAATYTTDVSYTYDRAGRTATVTDAAGVRTFSYYDSGSTAGTQAASARLKSETLPNAFGGHVLTYTYHYGSTDRKGTLGGLELNSSVHVSYGYDAVMRLNSVAYADDTAFTYTYVANSNLIDQVTQGASGYLRDYDYRTDSNRVHTLKHGWGNDPGKAIETTLSYNDLGLRNTEKTTGSGYMSALGRGGEAGVHTDYTYTDRMELNDSGKYVIGAGGSLGGLRAGTVRDYTYDPIGNRTADHDGTYVRNALNQYMAAPGLGALTYDANGNLLGDSQRSYEYDAENRLIKVTGSNGVWTYKYDYLGRRIEKSGPGGTTRFLYDGWNLLAELNASNTITRRFAWGLDVSGSLQGAGGVGGLLVIADDAGHYYPVYDASHNVVALYNASGGIAAAYEYDPFGVHGKQGVYAAQNPFRFSTKYTDSETDFIYYGHRYYIPALGRFLNRDPIEEAGGLNLYGFCGNDGVNRWDYLGMNSQDEPEDGGTRPGIVVTAPSGWTGEDFAHEYNTLNTINEINSGSLFTDRLDLTTTNNGLIDSVITDLNRAIQNRPTKQQLEQRQREQWVEMRRFWARMASRTWFERILDALAGYRSPMQIEMENSRHALQFAHEVEEGFGFLIDRGVSRLGGNAMDAHLIKFWAPVVLTGGFGRLGKLLATETTSVRVAGATRLGVVRNNPSDWRATRDLWDSGGFGEILSPANRARIARGRTPEVDEDWVRYFPEDKGLLGEGIRMHHIQGTPFTTPLPVTRHLDAHMPGGFRYNPGGPGGQVPIYVEPPF